MTMRRLGLQPKPAARLRPSGWGISTASFGTERAIRFAACAEQAENKVGMFTGGGALM